MVNQRKRRWLILTQYYPPEIGAPQIRLRSLARELTRHGLEVRVLTAMPNYPAGKIFPGYEGKRSCTETIDGISVRRTWIYAATGKSARIRLANYLSFTTTALFAALFGPRPDMIFLESQPISLGIVGLMMKWLRRVPYVYNIPDLQVEVAKEMGFMSNKTFLKVATWLENLFMKQSYSVSTVTYKFIEYFVKRGINRRQISFLPNGADADFLRPMAPDSELLDRWGLHNKKVFLYVGTHAFYHGLDSLIEAAQLLKAREDIRILMIGDGPERPRLKQMAENLSLDNVIFGESPYEEMARLYSIAYASVATLRNISVAQQMRLSKIFPSMSCAVPVIYSGVGEAADLIASENLGVVVEPENPALLAKAIETLADAPETRNNLGNRGRELIEREYAWSTIVGRWLKEISYPDLRAPQKSVIRGDIRQE